MADKAQITSTSFVPGAKVELYERSGDRWDQSGASGKRVGRAQKVGKDSKVQFTGLPEGDAFWLVAEVDGEDRAVQATAKHLPAGSPLKASRPRRSATKKKAPARKVVRGARSTANTKATVRRGGRKAKK